MDNVVVSVMIILLVIMATVFGATLLLSYLVTRMLGSPGWDNSNMTNALRLIAHVALHPEDFVHMHYVVRSASDSNLVVSRRAFPYLGQDELSEVVKTRPTKAERV